MRRFLLLLLIVAAGCASEPAGPALDWAALEADWQRWVADRDSLFRSPTTPLLPNSLTAFEGLTYFDYDSTFAVPAALAPSLDRDTVRFPTTTGELRRYVSAGDLVFEAGGVQRRLEAFETVEGPNPRLFVPFTDATNGRRTYGGGRYLDLELQPAGRYALDFNRAYHPYCVYNPTYSCPLPPPENRLELAVTAGERYP
ncbi:DUF1684 domain-containing protein [Rubrivirga marina]|uniref:DUF1684 domain-containing protein n=1 Tax=Rubrivirga marina TaxID=1196024 RepID=UPI001C5310C4|nr:DUF1684 domain-containing protein [Rubrivirga marina]